MDSLPQTSSAHQTNHTNEEDGMDSWLQQRRKERQDEIKRLQNEYDVQNSVRSVDNLLRSRFGEIIQESPQQAQPEGPVVVEIRALFETRPVTSILQSVNLRRTLENVVLAAGGSARAIRTFSSGLSSPSSRNTRSSSATHTPPSSSTHSIPAAVITPSAVTINNQEAATANNTAQAAPITVVEVPVIPPAPSLTTQNNPSQGSRNTQRHAQENSFMRHQHQEMVMEIRELLHQELVSRSLHSDFRQQLESIAMDRLWRSGQNGQAVLAALSNLPPTGHLRFARAQDDNRDFFWEQDALSNEDSDNISLLSARITTNGVSAVDGAAMQRQQAEMSKMKTEMKKMKQMMQLVFDMQIDLQRTMKQELSAALNRDTTRTTVSTVQVQKSKSVRVGQCLVCLDGKAEILVYRCGHLCLCHKCSLTLPHHQTVVTCPVCRAPVEDFVRVYDPSTETIN